MALALAVLLGRPPTVPPSVEPRQDRQSREHDDEGSAGVALRLLVQDLEQHVLTAPDEPSDPGEDGAPHQGSQASERAELPQVMRAIPAGIAIRCRTTGIIRPMNVLISPWSAT